MSNFGSGLILGAFIFIWLGAWLVISTIEEEKVIEFWGKRYTCSVEIQKTTWVPEVQDEL